MAKEATTPKPVAAEPVYEAKEIAANAPRLSATALTSHRRAHLQQGGALYA